MNSSSGVNGKMNPRHSIAEKAGNLLTLRALSQPELNMSLFT
jgi:hypothetical protein